MDNTKHVENNHQYFVNPPQSYWMASAPKTNFSDLHDDIKVDVAIIGGGIAGITCAYMLAKEGVKLAVIEANHILQGTTGHTTAKVTSQHDLIYNKITSTISEEFAMQYADANETAIRVIEETANKLNIDCDFIPQSAYIFTGEDKYIQKIVDEVKTAQKLGIKAEYLEKIPLDIPIKAAIRFNEQAQFHPLKYTLALADEIVRLGGQIYEKSKAIDLEESGTINNKESGTINIEKSSSYVITISNGKRVFANKVVIATHYPFYNKSGMYFAKINTDRSYVLAIKAKEKYPGGMYISAEDPVRSLRFQNSGDGELIFVGGEGHKTGQGKDTKTYYENLLRFAKNHYSVENIPYRWSTQDCMTLDGVPYVGNYKLDTPNLYITTGFGKWGMTNSTASSIILKDLIVYGKSKWEDVYNPSRQTILTSAANFVVESFNVAKELISGKIEELEDEGQLSKINKGEGQLLRINGKKTGAYRDEEGTLHLVNTTCTHMGCELTWNSAEKSWDCPCHGSRFSYEGQVIEGPALEPLSANIDVKTVEKLIKDDF